MSGETRAATPAAHGSRSNSLPPQYTAIGHVQSRRYSDHRNVPGPAIVEIAPVRMCGRLW